MTLFVTPEHGLLIHQVCPMGPQRNGEQGCSLTQKCLTNLLPLPFPSPPLPSLSPRLPFPSDHVCTTPELHQEGWCATVQCLLSPFNLSCCGCCLPLMATATGKDEGCPSPPLSSPLLPSPPFPSPPLHPPSPPLPTLQSLPSTGSEASLSQAPEAPLALPSECRGRATGRLEWVQLA